MAKQKHKKTSPESEKPSEENIIPKEESSSPPVPENGGEKAKAPEESEAEIIVGFTLEEVEELKKELETTRLEAKENFEARQRALADFSNLKRRVEREQDQMYQKAVGDVVRPFLDILDDLELALRNRPQDGEGAAWSEGINLIYRKLLTTLEARGVKVMEAEGKLFDPRFHEAITQEESDNHESGQIIEVVKPGYQIGERVLRPALVRVAS